jgi:hypothetical protein
MIAARPPLLNGVHRVSFSRQAMKCPFCESEMPTGTVSIAKSTLGEVMDVLDVLKGGAWSQPHYIYFHPTGGTAATHVDHSREAFHCNNCGTLILAGMIPKPEGRESRKSGVPKKVGGQRSTEGSTSNCPACGAAVNDRHVRCPDCDIALQ